MNKLRFIPVAGTEEVIVGKGKVLGMDYEDNLIFLEEVGTDVKYRRVLLLFKPDVGEAFEFPSLPGGDGYSSSNKENWKYAGMYVSSPGYANSVFYAWGA